MQLSWSVERETDVSLIRCRLHNDAAVPRRVRLRSRSDGPVLPPRRGGVPEPGWDADGATVRLGPGERRALGFATPAPAVDPPVEMDVTDPDATDGDGRSPSATAAARDLGSYRPPRDAIVAEPTDTDDVDPDGAARAATADAAEGSANKDAPDAVDPDARGPENTDGPEDAAGRRPGSECVITWLDAVERRVERGEQLADADVPTATAAVARSDGIDAIADLDGRLNDDAARLRRIEERVATLAARAERVDVPVEALRRLA